MVGVARPGHAPEVPRIDSAVPRAEAGTARSRLRRARPLGSGAGRRRRRTPTSGRCADLYVAGSRTGRADGRLLRGYLDRGLR